MTLESLLIVPLLERLPADFGSRAKGNVSKLPHLEGAGYFLPGSDLLG
jgi:hypothetical protein